MLIVPHFIRFFNLISRENYLVNEVQISKSLSIEETLSQWNLLREGRKV